MDEIIDLLTIQERMNRLFEDVVKNREAAETIGNVWSPLVDIYETESEIVIKAELTEVSQGEIQIDIAEDKLAISGERKPPADVKRDQFHSVERPYGPFSRSFVLSNNIDQEKIRANYRQGVLTITMPKRNEVHGRQIKVKIG